MAILFLAYDYSLKTVFNLNPKKLIDQRVMCDYELLRKRRPGIGWGWSWKLCSSLGQVVWNIILCLKLLTWIRSYQTFFLRKRKIFPFFAVKLGRFIENTPFFITYKHSNLKAKIGKQRKTKFGRIGSRQFWTNLTVYPTRYNFGLDESVTYYLNGPLWQWRHRRCDKQSHIIE